MLSGVAPVGCPAGAVVPRGRAPWRRGRALVAVGLIAGLGSAEASAHALGSLAASTGLLATLVVLSAIKGWPAVASATTVSTAGGALLIAVAVAWLVPGSAVGAWTGRLVRRSPLRRRRNPAFDRAVRSAPSARPRDFALEAELAEVFRRIHRAWDGAELAVLRASTTPDMLAELLRERAHGAEPVVGAASTPTEIVSVDVEWVRTEQLGTTVLASALFSGRLREGDADDAEAPFRELWLLTREDAPGADWRLARHQALY